MGGFGYHKKIGGNPNRPNQLPRISQAGEVAD
jgi:hypothetical protein